MSEVLDDANGYKSFTAYALSTGLGLLIGLWVWFVVHRATGSPPSKRPHIESRTWR